MKHGSEVTKHRTHIRNCIILCAAVYMPLSIYKRKRARQGGKFYLHLQGNPEDYIQRTTPRNGQPRANQSKRLGLARSAVIVNCKQGKEFALLFSLYIYRYIHSRYAQTHYSHNRERERRAVTEYLPPFVKVNCRRAYIIQRDQLPRSLRSIDFGLLYIDTILLCNRFPTFRRVVVPASRLLHDLQERTAVVCVYTIYTYILQAFA